MRLTKCAKLALNILRHSKLRSWLSIIGIVIGVASVIAIMSLGTGMQKTLKDRLGSLGADMVTITPGFSKATSASAGFRRGEFRGDSSNEFSTSVKNLTNKEVQTLKLIPNIGYIQGIISRRGEIGYFDEKASATIKGVDTAVWKNMEVTKLEYGRYLSQGDKNVAVIGSKIAKDKFKHSIPLNKEITIEGKPFRVVGILVESDGLGASNSVVFIPIEAARVTLESIGEKEFDSIEAKVKDINLMDDTLEQMTTRLMLVRAENERTKDFTINSVKAMQETISQTLNAMALFLTAIAAISLLVGSVGIANTMFTTVLEKTKDIGVMKSIGAKNKDIMLIFLLNSGMIGLTGGIIGGILGILGSKIVSMFMTSMAPRGADAVEAIVTLQTVLLVLGLSILIGILSGIIPAYKASKMNPVDALRYE